MRIVRQSPHLVLTKPPGVSSWPIRVLVARLRAVRAPVRVLNARPSVLSAPVCVLAVRLGAANAQRGVKEIHLPLVAMLSMLAVLTLGQETAVSIEASPVSVVTPPDWSILETGDPILDFGGPVSPADRNGLHPWALAQEADPPRFSMWRPLGLAVLGVPVGTVLDLAACWAGLEGDAWCLLPNLGTFVGPIVGFVVGFVWESRRVLGANE